MEIDSRHIRDKEKKMSFLIKEKDWSHTYVGPREEWPQSFQTLVEMLLDHPFASLLLWGPDLIQIYNDEYSTIAAKKHPEALGQPMKDCWPEVWHINQPIYQKVLEEGTSVVLEDQPFPIVGHTCVEDAYFTLSYSPVRNDEGGIAGIFLTIFETTESKEAEQKLRESESRLEAFVTATSEVVYRMSPDWSEMYHLDGREFIVDTEEPRKTWLEEYIPVDEQPRVIDAIDDAIKTKSMFDLEHQVVQVDGTLGWTYSRAIPILDDEGEIKEWFGTATDITERKQMEGELAQRRRALQNSRMKLRSLVHELSHAEENQRYILAGKLHDNLGQILEVCKIKFDVLMKDNDKGFHSEVHEIRDLINEAISCTRRLVNDLKPTPTEEKEDLGSALKWVAGKMEKYGLVVNIEHGENQKTVDQRNLNILVQVVQELLFNVVKHAEAGQAWLTVKCINGYIQIEVEDKGKGFDPNKVEESSGQDGFGLFNVRQRIDLLGGTVNIESEPGKGTTAIVQIPRKKAAPSDDNLPSKELTINRRFQDLTSSVISVLVVDDHQMMREGIAGIIDGENDMIVTDEASSGEEAIGIVDETRPDVVIMDVNLPGINGIEVTKKIKADYPDTKIIGLSFLNDQDLISNIFKAGASDFISKDEALQNICQSIREVAS